MTTDGAANPFPGLFFWRPGQVSLLARRVGTTDAGAGGQPSIDLRGVRDILRELGPDIFRGGVLGDDPFHAEPFRKAVGEGPLSATGERATYDAGLRAPVTIQRGGNRGTWVTHTANLASWSDSINFSVDAVGLRRAVGDVGRIVEHLNAEIARRKERGSAIMLDAGLELAAVSPNWYAMPFD